MLAGHQFPVLPTQAYLQITGLYDLKGGASLGSLAQWQLSTDTAICTDHLAGHWLPAQQAALQTALGAPELQTSVDQLLGKVAAPAA